MKIQISEELNTRLSKLPGRVSQPLIGLYELGHLDAMVLTTVLDAGDLSNDVNRLSAFTSSYLYLRQQSIPVADVIHMSKLHGRRINLWWSAKRWQLEHDKLSRLETLKTLARENISYDVCTFTNRLPVVFPGYLIKGSLRLGMEGLRQRHCVASWHSKLQTGACAIAAVFVDGKRWTVELFKSYGSELTLSVGQIKTRFNAAPDKAMRGRILDALGITEKTSEVSTLAARGQLYRQNIASLIPMLRQLNVQSITATFSGCGDSGQIDGVNIVPSEAGSVEVPLSQIQNILQDGTWHLTRVETTSRLDDAISEILYDYLEATGVNWYDNDGGQGEFSLDLDSDELMLRVDQNYVETSTEFDAEYTLEEFIAFANE